MLSNFFTSKYEKKPKRKYVFSHIITNQKQRITELFLIPSKISLGVLNGHYILYNSSHTIEIHGTTDAPNQSKRP